MMCRVSSKAAPSVLLALLAAALAGGAACAPTPTVAGPMTANQEPVALLALPDHVEAGVPTQVSIAGSFDVDGTLVHRELTWGDGSAPDVAEITDVAPAPSLQTKLTHTWASPGLYDVELALTDAGGAVGRARLRVSVTVPPDVTAPSLTHIVLRVGDDTVPLVAGAALAPDAVLSVDVEATDAEGALDHVDVDAADAHVTLVLAGSDAAVTGQFDLAGLAGNIEVRVVAVDTAGNQSDPTTIGLHVLGPDDDTDGDGLPDLTDPAPHVWNGLRADVFALDSDIPTDLFGNQRAETLVEGVRSLTPVMTLDVGPTPGWLTMAPTSAPLSTAPSFVALAALEDGAIGDAFAVRYAGMVQAPPGADGVVVEISADDVGVVFVDGAPVASADGEYATDFFRLERVPSTSDTVALPANGRVPVEIVVANGQGQYAWDVRFRFLSGGASVMNPEAVGQRQFEVP